MLCNTANDHVLDGRVRDKKYFQDFNFKNIFTLQAQVTAGSSVAFSAVSALLSPVRLLTLLNVVEEEVEVVEVADVPVATQT